jgi:hypothetical protein
VFEKSLWEIQGFLLRDEAAPRSYRKNEYLKGFQNGISGT